MEQKSAVQLLGDLTAPFKQFWNDLFIIIPAVLIILTAIITRVVTSNPIVIAVTVLVAFTLYVMVCATRYSTIANKGHRDVQVRTRAWIANVATGVILFSLIDLNTQFSNPWGETGWAIAIGFTVVISVGLVCI